MQVFASWSGGKDSCFACYQAISDGLQVSWLLNMVTEDARRSHSHGLSTGLVQAQAQALGIPIVQRGATWEKYEGGFKEAVLEPQYRGIEGGVIGDIDGPEHREWVERVCREMGIRAFLPLLGRRQGEILKEFIDSGFKAIVVAVKADLFGEEWLGREIDADFFRRLSELESKLPVSLCGEAGEYHSFVVDGPLFQKRIEILDSAKVERDGYRFLSISNYRLKEK